MTDSDPRKGLPTHLRIFLIVFVVALLTVPLYCAFATGEGPLPPDPPGETEAPGYD